MTVIFPGGDFSELMKNRKKNKFVAGNIAVIKSFLTFFFKTNYCEINCQGLLSLIKNES